VQFRLGKNQLPFKTVRCPDHRLHRYHVGEHGETEEAVEAVAVVVDADDKQDGDLEQSDEEVEDMWVDADDSHDGDLEENEESEQPDGVEQEESTSSPLGSMQGILAESEEHFFNQSNRRGMMRRSPRRT
jgi:hypothetical protein